MPRGMPPSLVLARRGRRLEQVSPADLELPRLAQAAPQGAVEIAEYAGARRIAEVVGVGDVEDLEDGLERPPRTQVERSREADVPREEGVVLADGVPLEHVP